MNSYFLYLRDVKENRIFSFKCALVLSGEQIAHRVRRKYSLGSSLDLVRTQLILINSNMITQKTSRKPASAQLTLGPCHVLQVKPKKDLFRQSVLPRLQRADKKNRLSASCTQLRPLNEDNMPSESENYQSSKHR